MYKSVRIIKIEQCAWCSNTMQIEEEVLETEDGNHYCSIVCLRGAIECNQDL